MRTNRWERARNPSVGRPTPVLKLPNAYDVKLNVNHRTRTVSLGPLSKRDPQSPYFSTDIKFDKIGGQSGQQVKGYTFDKTIQFTYNTKGKKQIEIQWLGAVPTQLPADSSPQASPPPVVATTNYDITIL